MSLDWDIHPPLPPKRLRKNLSDWTGPLVFLMWRGSVYATTTWQFENVSKPTWKKVGRG